jgi:hypothetical protein
MTKRSSLTLLLLVAFLLSAWGNVVAAAFCPAYLARNCRVRQQTQPPTQVDHKSCHHEMGNMEIGDMKMDEMEMDEDPTPQSEITSFPENLYTQIAPESSFAEAALEFPGEPCGHCWMHSQPTSGTGTMAIISLSSRLIEGDAPFADSVIELPSAFSVPITPVEHGPPGNSLPRHVLINVFRI